MKQAQQLLDFMKIMEKLCLVHRDNLLSDGSRNESDSDHIFKLTFWIMLIYPYLKTKVDYTKMLEMALIHDIVEARAGDVSLSEQYNNPELKNIKKQKEKDAIEYYKSILPSPLNDKIYDIFMEYEERQTKEAQIVWCMDKLDAHYQANLHQDGNIKYWADCPNGEVYYHMVAGHIPTKEKETLENLNEEILLELEDIIIKLSQENMKKCSIKVEKTA